MNNEKHLWPGLFIQISDFFKNQKRYEEGLDIILKALDLFPYDLWLRVKAGDFYRYMGSNQQAVEQYQQALAIDPENSQAKSYLIRMKKINLEEI